MTGEEAPPRNARRRALDLSRRPAISVDRDAHVPLVPTDIARAAPRADGMSPSAGPRADAVRRSYSGEPTYSESYFAATTSRGERPNSSNACSSPPGTYATRTRPGSGPIALTACTTPRDDHQRPGLPRTPAISDQEQELSLEVEQFIARPVCLTRWSVAGWLVPSRTPIAPRVCSLVSLRLMGSRPGISRPSVGARMTPRGGHRAPRCRHLFAPTARPPLHGASTAHTVDAIQRAARPSSGRFRGSPLERHERQSSGLREPAIPVNTRFSPARSPLRAPVPDHVHVA